MNHGAQVEEFWRRYRTGLLTLLFTDIVGSTSIKQTLGAREGAALIQQHRALVRELLGPFESEEIETAGDSFFIVFAKPSDAVRFSLRLQARLRAAHGSTHPLRVRIAIHIGEVVLLVGDLTHPLTTDWAGDVSDPLLRDDLKRCFAGNPQQRFSGAGELSRSLRAARASSQIGRSRGRGVSTRESRLSARHSSREGRVENAIRRAWEENARPRFETILGHRDPAPPPSPRTLVRPW